MKLDRPIVFLDTETTGTDTIKDRICQLGLVKLMPDLVTRYPVEFLINPEIPIPKEASDVHGITDEMVKNCPKLIEIAPSFLQFIDGCDIGSFNGNRFDVPLIYNELQRIGINWVYKNFSMIDAFTIFSQRERRDLTAAVKFYTGKDLIGAHGAIADTQATVDVFLGQLQMYPDLPDNVSDMAIYCNGGKKRIDLAGKFKYNDADEICFTFGKYVNKTASEVLKIDRGYLSWMLTSKDFTADTKAVVTYLLKKL